MGFIETLFALSGGGVWATSLIWFILILALTENDNDIAAGIAFALYAFGINWYNEIDFSFWNILIWSVGYVCFGAVWSVVKWFSFLRLRADKFDRYKHDWITEYNKRAKKSIDSPADTMKTIDVNATVAEMRSTLSQSEFARFFQGLQRNGLISDYSDEASVIPNWRNEKTRFIRWIVWWPTSMFWTFLNDPIVRLAHFMHRYLGGVYQRIADKVYSKVGVTETDFTGMK